MCTLSRESQYTEIAQLVQHSDVAREIGISNAVFVSMTATLQEQNTVAHLVETVEVDRSEDMALPQVDM